MKKYLLIAAFAGLIACDSKKTDEKKEEAKVQVPVVAPIPVATKPNEVGRMVFAMLKTLDNQHNLASLQSKFLTMEELREMADNPNLIKSGTLQDNFKRGTRESFEEDRARDNQAFKKNATEYQIDWQNIEYFDYLSLEEAKEKEDAGLYMRILEFKSKGKKYGVLIFSLFNGKEYKVVKVEELSLAPVK